MQPTEDSIREHLALSSDSEPPGSPETLDSLQVSTQLHIPQAVGWACFLTAFLPLLQLILVPDHTFPLGQEPK